MQTKPVVNCKITLEFIIIYINNPHFSEFHPSWDIQGEQVKSSSTGLEKWRQRSREAVLRPRPVLTVCGRHRVPCPQLHTRCLEYTLSGVHCSSTILLSYSIIRSKCYVLIIYSTYSQRKVNKCQTFKEGKRNTDIWYFKKIHWYYCFIHTN